MNEVTIYHNPKCSSSRNTLALIRHCGLEPVIVEYLKTPPSREKIKSLQEKIGKPLRDIMRSGEEIYKKLELANPKHSDDELIDIIVANPILINRPIVETAKGARLCRPFECVLEILPKTMNSPFTKENGEVVQG